MTVRVSAPAGVGACFWFRVPYDPVNVVDFYRGSHLPYTPYLVADDNGPEPCPQNEAVQAATGTEAQCVVDTGQGSVLLRGKVIRPRWYDQQEASPGRPMAAQAPMPVTSEVKEEIVSTTDVAQQVEAITEGWQAEAAPGPAEQDTQEHHNEISMPPLKSHVSQDALPRESPAVSEKEKPLSNEEEDAATHILLIDDTRAVLEIHALELECYGYRCTTVLGAEEGFLALKQGNYDLVLCDYKMPSCNGHELASKFRHWEALHSGGGRSLPIYALTAYATEEIKERCLKSGMQGVLLKPLKAQDVIDKVKYHFAKRGNRGGY